MKHLASMGGVALLVLAAAGCYQASTTKSAVSSTSATTSPATTSPAATAPAAKPAGTAPAAAEVELPGGLKYVDLKVGEGDIAEAGLTATVHYTGWLTDGTKFDSSLDRNQPLQFRIGAGNVIRGWDEGVKGMRIGGKRHLTIPPDMGYGAAGYAPVIPPNATLVFDVELLGLAR